MEGRLIGDGALFCSTNSQAKIGLRPHLKEVCEKSFKGTDFILFNQHGIAGIC